MLIKNFNNLNLSKERKIALTIVETGLRALNYKKVIQEKFFNKYLPQIKRYRKIYLIGFGKGSSQVADILRKRISFKEIYVIDLIMVQTNANNTGIESILNRRKSVLNSHKSVGIFTKGTHPLPSLKNFQFTEKVIRRFSGQLTKNDLVIVVVCGGGSAMLTYPCLSQTLADYTHLPAGRQGLNADNIKSQNHAERTQNLQNISIKASKNGRISSGEGSHKFTNYPQTHTEDNFRIDPFNNPQLSALLKKYIQINQQLLKSGADIYEMNTIRKHLRFS
ncbi:MAG: hypothetical protein KatS3mg095_0427 [Candidatus Parcubacteria bacterium]|nr:MAG: hypothetical protein KatS3mg095_0427 [Candidatus Parcubacteria bacterium]